MACTKQRGVTMNFVIVGTNFISDTLLSAAKQIEQFSLYGVCSREQQTGESFLAKHDMTDAKVFTNIEQVCQDPLVDAVYIAAPNSLHKDYAVMCLKAGKHVLGEKPSAANSVELELIIEAAKENQRLYMEAMMTTHLPNFARLKILLLKLAYLANILVNIVSTHHVTISIKMVSAQIPFYRSLLTEH